MSGKGSKKPAAAAAAKAPKKTKPAQKSPKKKKDADDPFGAAPVKSTSAIQAAPKPMKGRLLKVVCPMCDTPGFIPRKAAGRDIRCANKKCMVPVFKAPAPKRETETAAAPESGSSALPIIAGIVGLAVVGGIIYVMFGGNSTPENVTKKQTPVEEVDVKNTLEDYKKQRKAPTKTTAKTMSLSELRESVLKELSETAAKSKENKPFCRLMTSQGFAAVGQLDRAESQLDLIAKPGSPDYYKRAMALAAISRGHLKAGDKTKAVAVAKQAIEAAGSLPQFGQAEFEVRAAVAVALVAAGELNSAADFVAASGRDLKEPLTYHSAVAAARRGIAIAAAEATNAQSTPPQIADGANPTWVAVASELYIAGHGSEAVAWSAAAKNKAVRVDSLAAVATLAGADGNQPIVAACVGKAEGAEALTRVNAAAAFGAASTNQTNAATLVSAAEKAAAGVPQPKPVVLNSARDVYDYSVPNDEPARIAAFAFAELARAQAKVNGAGKDTLLTALRHTHTYCPAPQFIENRTQDSFTTEALAAALRMSPAEARTARNKFRSKLKSLQRVCEGRTNLQAEILARLASSKLADAVWQLVDSNAGKNVG